MSVVDDPRCNLWPEAHAFAAESNREVCDRVTEMFQWTEQTMPSVRSTTKQFAITEPVSDFAFDGPHLISLAHRCR